MLGYGDIIILVSTDGEILGSTFGAADRNTIGIFEGTITGSPDGSGLLYVKELGGFVGLSDRSTQLPRFEQTCTGL